MIERVRAFIENKKLANTTQKILVAVSGGVDSIVLVHLLKELAHDVAVAHTNFQLRGEASDKDEQFVKDWCESNGVVCHARRVNTAGVADQQGISIQMAARELRYSWFEELLEEHNYQKIATAHHLNDSLETVLLNLTKGTGIRGLAGIPAVNERLIRPLIEITKEEILAYAKERDLKWREDTSNADSKYQRNFIRNEVVPLLRNINPSLLETFKSTSDRICGANELIQEMVNTIRNENFNTEGEERLNMLWFDGSAGHLVILSELLRPFGVSYSLACEIGEGHESGKVFLTTSHTILYDRDQLIFTKNENLVSEPLEITKPEETFVWGNWKITVNMVNPEDAVFGDEQVAHFDASKAIIPITVRFWQEGDWFIPLGMTGKKMVSDFMIDNKIPLTFKSKIPIFDSGSKIMWIGGYRVDDRYKVGEETKEVVRVEIREI
ncbi:MAG: tRNA lysidine(34) synthetase TilS [Cytophagales bacterium]|nr:tRNA lysidine(34) synthetase TilS [Cytophagales bacterium]